MWGAVELWLEHVMRGGAVVRTCGAMEQWLEHVGRGGAVVRTRGARWSSS